jgi:hypothetical protein
VSGINAILKDEDDGPKWLFDASPVIPVCEIGEMTCERWWAEEWRGAMDNLCGSTKNQTEYRYYTGLAPTSEHLSMCPIQPLSSVPALPPR